MSLAALALAASACLAVSESHRAPEPSLADVSAKTADREDLLGEMRSRGLIGPEAVQWSPQDLALLGRLRRAEAAGALAMLRRRAKSLKGLAAEYRPVGAKAAKLRLTKEGFERYLAMESQEAVSFFESKDVDVKWVFLLADLEGHPLFDGGGLLTDAGDALYLRAAAGKPAFWKTPPGEVMGTRPPKRVHDPSLGSFPKN